MLIDTRQVITKSQLRNNLSEILMLVNRGKKMMISDRGKLIVKIIPVKERLKAKKEKTDSFMTELKKLKKTLSRKNPNFDSVKAIRAIRREN